MKSCTRTHDHHTQSKKHWSFQRTHGARLQRVIHLFATSGTTKLDETSVAPGLVPWESWSHELSCLNKRNQLNTLHLQVRDRDEAMDHSTRNPLNHGHRGPADGQPEDTKEPFSSYAAGTMTNVDASSGLFDPRAGAVSVSNLPTTPVWYTAGAYPSPCGAQSSVVAPTPGAQMTTGVAPVLQSASQRVAHTPQDDSWILYDPTAQLTPQRHNLPPSFRASRDHGPFWPVADSASPTLSSWTVPTSRHVHWSNAVHPDNSAALHTTDNTAAAADPTFPWFRPTPASGVPSAPPLSWTPTRGTEGNGSSRTLQHLSPIPLHLQTPPRCNYLPKNKTSLLQRSTGLLMRLQNLLSTNREDAQRVYAFFQDRSAQSEADRAAQLSKVTQAPTVVPIVNEFFDLQMHSLMDNVELQLDQLSRTPAGSYTSQFSNAHLVTPQPNEPRHVKAAAPKRKKAPALNSTAVGIMQRWYNANVDYPYPSVDTTESMARAGSITEEQVKKWFANKRMRDRNTRPNSRKRGRDDTDPSTADDSERANKRRKSGH